MASTARLWMIAVLQSFLYLRFLFHVNLVAILVVEMILKVCKLLVGNDPYSHSVTELPLPVQGDHTLVDVCSNVRVYV